MSNERAIGFSTNTVKKPLLNTNLDYPHASETIRNEDGAIFTREFSSFSSTDKYTVSYESRNIPGYQESYDGVFVVRHLVTEEKKISQVRWGLDEDENGEKIKDDFQSWQVVYIDWNLVSIVPDRIVGSLRWYWSPPENVYGEHMPLPAVCTEEQYNDPNTVCLCRYYKLENSFREEEWKRPISMSTSVSTTVPDDVWGVKPFIPPEFEAYIINSDGQREDLKTDEKQILKSSTIYLERPCDTKKNLLISFLGEEYRTELELIEQRLGGWEHHDEPPQKPEEIRPPKGDYSDISFERDSVESIRRDPNIALLSQQDLPDTVIRVAERDGRIVDITTLTDEELKDLDLTPSQMQQIAGQSSETSVGSEKSPDSYYRAPDPTLDFGTNEGRVISVGSKGEASPKDPKDVFELSQDSSPTLGGNLNGDNYEIKNYRKKVERVEEGTTLKKDQSGIILEVDTLDSEAEIELPKDLPKGWNIQVVQVNDGQAKFKPEPRTNAELKNRDDHNKTDGPWSVVHLYVSSNDDDESAIYVLSGDTGI